MKRIVKMIAVLMGSAAVIGGPVNAEAETSVPAPEKQASPMVPVKSRRATEADVTEEQTMPVPPGR